MLMSVRLSVCLAFGIGRCCWSCYNLLLGAGLILSASGVIHA